MHSSEIRVKDQSWCCGSGRQRMAGTFERHQIKGKGLTCNRAYKKHIYNLSTLVCLHPNLMPLNSSSPLAWPEAPPKALHHPSASFSLHAYSSAAGMHSASHLNLSQKRRRSKTRQTAQIPDVPTMPRFIQPSADLSSCLCAGLESQKTQSTINRRDQSNSNICVRNLLLNFAVL